MDAEMEHGDDDDDHSGGGGDDDHGQVRELPHSGGMDKTSGAAYHRFLMWHNHVVPAYAAANPITLIVGRRASLAPRQPLRMS